MNKHVIVVNNMKAWIEVPANKSESFLVPSLTPAVLLTTTPDITALVSPRTTNVTMNATMDSPPSQDGADSRPSSPCKFPRPLGMRDGNHTYRKT
jgi:hypothetical protein